MKVLFDSNVLIDILLTRGDFVDDALACLEAAEQHIVKGYVSASAITDIHYIVRKELHDSEKALIGIKRLLEILKVAKVDTKTIATAVQLDWNDFEDCVQYCAAKHCGVKCVLTRDSKGFSESEIPVFSPKEFLTKIN